MLPTKDPLQIYGHILTENNRMETISPYKWKLKESWNSNTHIRQNRFSNKDRNKRQRSILHNDHGIHLRRRYNNCKY